ncbi:murein biosynthesis integral membrane protein MurJ [Maritimibacter sp. DP1N21-5]|uniref:murein biosynthesis integral membrane protein MurJ n=1 Tax=Maritimibacter sp. DP1N21-5 TaxID=2836867 RepID=UPI001C43D632|nr:lipid II flippase MurJ [Maritimibacter sp. DP1N21-5]MBV7407497.1 hypothetical protein [Maritimibacter sp. DP1N21-5]
MNKSVLSIAVGNLGSKVIAFARELLFAAWFGTSDTAAAFRIGQTAFLLPTHAIIGDTLSAGLLPLYRRLQTEDDPEGPRLLVLSAVLYALVVSAVITTGLFLFAASVARVIAPGASAEALGLAARLLRIMALATPFYVLAGLLSYLETAYGRFGAIAWRPSLLNIGAISGAALAVYFGVDIWLAGGVLAGHVLFFVWTAVQLCRLDRMLPIRPALRPLWRVFRRFAVTVLPLLGLPLAAQTNVLVERMVSSWLGTAVIPAVDYARFIAETTIQLVAIPLGVLTLSRFGGDNGTAMRTHVAATLRAMVVFTVPIGIFIGLEATGIVRLVYARGAFDARSVEITANILRWIGYAIGATTPAYYLIKALNAQLRNGEALRITVLASAANIMVNLALWQVAGPATIGIGLATYGLVMLVFALRAHSLSGEAIRLVPWLGLGVGLQGILSLALPSLLATMVASLALWLCLLQVAPPLREAAGPVLTRVPGLRRFYA